MFEKTAVFDETQPFGNTENFCCAEYSVLVTASVAAIC